MGELEQSGREYTIEEICKNLMAMQDLGYRKFHCGLMPGVDPDTVIGIRTPALRKYARELYRQGGYEEFLGILPHMYYEEMNLHGLLLCEMADYDDVVTELDRFLPYVNNWATCDMIHPQKAFGGNLDRLITDISRWIADDRTYVVRFGMEMLMCYYLGEAFRPEYLDWVAKVRSEEYYVKMMQAWFFATALAKQYEETLPYIKEHRLEDWTHRKSIQKARESCRISMEQKELLKQLK